MTQAARWTTGPQRLKPLQAAPTQHPAQVGHVNYMPAYISTGQWTRNPWCCMQRWLTSPGWQCSWNAREPSVDRNAQVQTI